MTFYITDKDGNEVLEFYPSSTLTNVVDIFNPEIHSLWVEGYGDTDYAEEFETLCTIIEREIVDKVFAALEVWPMAYNLETALDAFDKHYVDYFEDEEEFVESIMERNYPEIPGFLVVDWQSTGERLKQDYLEYDGYYFRK
jgi:hypothetical protein